MDYTPPDRQKMKHVERKDLYLNLRKRIEYLHAFLDFTAEDIATLNKGSKFLKASIPTLAHRLYEKLLQFDLTAKALKIRNTNSDTEIDDLFTIDSPHVQRRKIFWKWYLTRLVSDPSRMEYWEYLDKIGRMHRGRILIHPLHIEYLHMNVMLGYVQDLFFETISNNKEFSGEFRFQLIRSMNKLLNVQNDLITRWYVKDGEEFYQDDKENNDMAFTEQPMECPFKESEIAEERPSSGVSSSQKSISSKSEREKRHLSHLVRPAGNGTPIPSPPLTAAEHRSIPSSGGESRKSDKLSGEHDRTHPRTGAFPVPITRKNGSVDSGASSMHDHDRSALPRHQGISPAVAPYTAAPLPGTNLGTFETKIWSEKPTTKEKKSYLGKRV